MKRKILTMMLLTCVLLLAGCGLKKGSLKGEVVSYGGEPLMFELECEDGKKYGFLISEETELIWEDETAFSTWEDTNVEYDEWDIFDDGMHVTVMPGDKALGEEDDIDEQIEEWFLAKKITVTDSLND